MKSTFRTFQNEVERHKADVEQEKDFWRSLDRGRVAFGASASQDQIQLAQRALHAMDLRRLNGEDTPAGIRAWAGRLARDVSDAGD